tara:strand:- start:498 stop:1088 length:591 start_codon:yes stop_codon:yes gene_type:complete
MNQGVLDKISLDQKYWIQLINGEKDALGFLFDIYSNDMYLYGYRIHANKEIVKDAIQDVFVDLWEYRKNLAHVENVKFYLLKCLRNSLLKQIEKPNLLELNQISDSFGAFPAIDYNIVLEEEERSTKYRIERMLGELSNREREIISLKYYSGLKITEIANVLELKDQTVANTLQNALGKLRKLFVFNVLLIYFLFF